MLHTLLLSALLSAVNPWERNDPFPLPATYASVLHEGKLSANLGYRGVFENWEIDGVPGARPYEQWNFFQEANPFLRYELSRYAELKTGLRIKHELGGEVNFQPRFAYIDERPKHSFIFGNFRASWNPGLLYQPVSADDHLGAYFRIGRIFGLEGFVSRPDALADNQYERYVAAGRLGLRHGGPFVFYLQGLIEHAAGFDTAGLPYTRPSIPTSQMIQTGAYAEINFLDGRRSGLHAEYQHTSGEAVWNGARWKPHGRYRAFGGHATAFNITAMAEYRRVDPTFVAPQGALEYRMRYPELRNDTPDEVVGQLRWFYAFHTNASVMIDVEQAFFTKKRSLRSEGNQNRTTFALQAQF